MTPPIGAENDAPTPTAQAASSSFETAEPTPLPPAPCAPWLLFTLFSCGCRLCIKMRRVPNERSNADQLIHAIDPKLPQSSTCSNFNKAQESKKEGWITRATQAARWTLGPSSRLFGLSRGCRWVLGRNLKLQSLAATQVSSGCCMTFYTYVHGSPALVTAYRA